MFIDYLDLVSRKSPAIENIRIKKLTKELSDIVKKSGIKFVLQRAPERYMTEEKQTKLVWGSGSNNYS